MPTLFTIGYVHNSMTRGFHGLLYPYNSIKSSKLSRISYLSSRNILDGSYSMITPIISTLTSPQSFRSITIHRRYITHSKLTLSSIKPTDSSLPCKMNRYHPKSVRLGWSSHVIKELLPCTAEIITSKARPFENIAVGYCLQSDYSSLNFSESSVLTKSVDDSYLEIILPFADQPELRESMMRRSKSSSPDNPGTLLYGKLFEVLDALAADVSYRHCDGGKSKYTIVTASIDGFRAFETSKKPIDIMSSDMKLQGYLTYVGSSSMEVTIDLISKDIYGEEHLVGTTQFIMVARDPKTNKAAPIHKLLLDNLEIKEEFDRGQKRAASRKKRAASSLSITPPSHDEVEFMHKLYVESKEMKAQKNILLQDKLDFDSNLTIQKSYSSYKWMKNTTFKSVLMMHMQKRNVHGKIFGGYILKIAYDMAFISAACFFGVEDPVFVCVDDVQFVKPVSIGSIMEFTSTVAYNRDDAIVIQVDAADVNYSSGQRTKTNILSYVFKYPETSNLSQQKQTFPQVMPLSYDEFILYLEGRRTLTKLTSSDVL